VIDSLPPTLILDDASESVLTSLVIGPVKITLLARFRITTR
jgi:hypothetical protein